MDAPMERVWALVRDYRVARTRFLSEHFSDDGVRERGTDAGTVIAYRLRVGRHERGQVVIVQEPVAGRMLRERARDSALVSTWSLTPGGEGDCTVVRLAVGPHDPQISGWLARVRARRALRPSAASWGRAVAWFDQLGRSVPPSDPWVLAVIATRA